MLVLRFFQCNLRRKRTKLDRRGREDDDEQPFALHHINRLRTLRVREFHAIGFEAEHEEAAGLVPFVHWKQLAGVPSPLAPPNLPIS